MAITVKRITLWRTEVENQPGCSRASWSRSPAAGADLRLIMGYRLPQAPERAAIELYPITGKRLTTAAQEAGLAEAKDIPSLLVEGDNRPGLGVAIGRGLAERRHEPRFRDRSGAGTEVHRRNRLLASLEELTAKARTWHCP